MKIKACQINSCMLYAKTASLDISDIFQKKMSAAKFLFIKVSDKLVIFWDYSKRYWTVASAMDKKEQNPFCKRKRTTPKKKNVRYLCHGGKKNGYFRQRVMI